MAENKLSDEQKPEALREFAADVRSEVAPPNFTADVVECCADTIDQLRTRCRELEEKCNSVMHRNAELQADLLDDKEKAAIRDLIAEHGIVDSSLWYALKTQRDEAIARRQELEKRLFTKARFTKTHENAYTDEELLEMFGPFILEGCTTGLSPRECRLLETIADANAQLAAVTAERDELRKQADAHMLPRIKQEEADGYY